MKAVVSGLVPAAAVLLLGIAGCQQAPQREASLTAEEVAAVGKTIDTAIETYVAKDLERHMTFAAADAIGVEFDRRFEGIDEIRERHIRPEMADMTVGQYRAADRIVRGRNGLAYVSERNLLEFKDKEGKTYKSDSAWASYVMEKQADGAWKCKLAHFSGPMNWQPVETGKAAAKK